MVNMYTVFKTNLPVPIGVNLNCTNIIGEIEPLHTTRDIRIGISKAKYACASKINYMQIVYCYKGSFKYVTDVGTFDVKEGECLLLGRQRIMQCDENEKRPHLVYTFKVNKEFCAEIGADDSLTGVVPVTDIVAEKIKAIIKEIDEKAPDWKENVIDIAKDLLLYATKKYKKYSHSIEDEDYLPDSVMQEILDYVTANMGREIKQEELCEIAGLKSSQFNKKFKITTGMTPIKYMQLRRCGAARDLILTTDFDIDDIILFCGYSSKSYFYKCYKDIMGTNAYEEMLAEKEPSEYKPQ